MKKSIYFLIFILCFVNNYIQAQHPVYTQLTEKDGLPDIEFYDIIEDKEGFIWLAANKGLFRYDGKEFKSYTHPNKKGLSVFGLKFDEQGRLWCNNISGQLFYVENDALQLFEVEIDDKGTLTKFLFYKNFLWNYSFSSLMKTNLKTKEKTIVKNKHDVDLYLKNDTLFFIEGDKLRFTTNNKKVNNSLIIEGEAITQKYKGLQHLLLYKQKVFYISSNPYYKDNRADVWFYENNKIKKIKTPKELQNCIIHFSYVEEDLIWFCTGKGVYVYSFKNNIFQLQKTYFKGKKITKVIKDRNDNYWFITLENGVYIVSNIYLENYTLKEKASNITRMKSINDTLALLGSTKGCLVTLHKQTKKLDYVSFHNNQKVFSIGSIKENTYISFHKGAGVYNAITKKVTTKKVNEILKQAKDIVNINDNKILYALSNYARIFNLKDNNTLILDKKRAYTVHYNNTFKEIYVGYVDGLKKYNEQLEATDITFKDSPIFAINIEETANGIIWVSTFKDGVIGIQKGKVVANYTTKQGLLSNQTSTIQADGDLLWIVSDKSIQVLNTITKKIKNLTLKDGITTFNITDIVPTKKTIFFSSNKGLFEFDREKVFKNRALSEFYIKNIFVDDVAYAEKDFKTLKANTNKIQFHFHTNGFLAEDNITYQYRLLGASENWENVSENVNVITFNNLISGKYVFELKAKEVNGNNITNTKSIHFKINTPIYKQKWFIISIIIVIGFLIWYLFHLRIKKLRKKQKLALEKEHMREQLVAFKLKGLKAQMNPHFTFNALNSIQDYIMLNQKNLAGDYLGKFADLIRNYLHFSDIGAISISEEVENLNLYLELEKLRFEDELNYMFYVDIIDTDTIKIPTMLLQPYIENALKHGLLHKKGLRKLRISIMKSSEEIIECIIEDNGIGRKKSQEINQKKTSHHKSFALKATTERLDLLNYGKDKKIGVQIIDLLEGDIALGTKVILKIPIV